MSETSQPESITVKVIDGQVYLDATDTIGYLRGIRDSLTTSSGQDLDVVQSGGMLAAAGILGNVADQIDMIGILGATDVQHP
jgi:hypothetical protein